MKKLNIKIIGLTFLMILALGSCKKWINTDINTSPDSPADVPMGSILTGVQANMGYNTIGGNDLCRVTSIWLQYFQGIARQSQATTNYYLLPSDINNLWITNYTNTMMNLITIRGKAKAANNPTFLGIADVLLANSLGITSDFWGDIPYSQAFQGMTNLQPPFDRQESVYATILLLLQEAIEQLGTAGAPAAEGDVMYGGEPALWLEAAHSLNARYILHKCKLDPTAWTNALAALEGGISSNSNDLEFQFFDAAGQQNPLYQFMQQRGDITMHKVFMDTLWKVRHDPRTPVFATASPDTANPYIGNGWGEISNDVSLPGDAVAGAASVVPFVTYVETLFIKAECLFKTGAADDVIKAALIAAVTASLEKWNVADPIWIGFYTAAINAAPHQALYVEIMRQKWIALYNQAEAFNDWRRTNNVIGLVSNPLSSAQFSEIPRHYPEAQSELNYNSNTPKDITLLSRVWWDSQLTK